MYVSESMVFFSSVEELSHSLKGSSQFYQVFHRFVVLSRLTKFRCPLVHMVIIDIPSSPVGNDDTKDSHRFLDFYLTQYVPEVILD